MQFFWKTQANKWSLRKKTLKELEKQPGDVTQENIPNSLHDNATPHSAHVTRDLVENNFKLKQSEVRTSTNRSRLITLWFSRVLSDERSSSPGTIWKWWEDEKCSEKTVDWCWSRFFSAVALKNLCQSMTNVWIVLAAMLKNKYLKYFHNTFKK